MSQNIFGSESGSALPGGSVAKPLIIALLALLASRAMSGGGQKSAPAQAPKLPESLPGSTDDASPGNVLDGLGGLVKQFQQKGLGEVIDSWVNQGKNKGVAPDQVTKESIGLVILLFGDSNWGAFSPVPAA